MADFEPIAVNTTAEKLEKIANMDILAEKVEEENDNALVSATALLKTLVGNVDLSNYYIKIWQPNTEYKVGDVVLGFKVSGIGSNQAADKLCIFKCEKDHTSSQNINNDLSRWKETMITVDKSAKDGLGNFITDTYATKEELEEALENVPTGEGGTVAVDQTYNPESENAQSGIAVAEAIENHSQYFGITDNGIVWLKPEYRGTGDNSCIYSISDSGLGNNGTKNHLLPKRLIIPLTIKNIAVTTLADGMFYGNLSVETVVLPNGIIKIPTKCFYGTTNLNDIENTNSIGNIGTSAFMVSGIKYGVFPSLTSLGNEAFRVAFNLEFIELGNGITALPEKGFENCQKLNTIYGGKVITSIAKRCFYNCVRLKNVVFISNLTSIGDYAFKNCNVQYDWDTLTCTFGTCATSKQMHTTDVWSGVEIENTVINELPLSINQDYFEWSNRVIGENSYQPTDTFSEGCVFFAVMGAYCGLNRRYDLKTAFDLKTEATKKSAIDYFTGKLANINHFVSALGLIAEVYSQFTAETIKAIYSALQGGKYVIIPKSSSYNSAVGHVVLAYGINKDNGEIMYIDTQSTNGTNNPRKVKEGEKVSMPIKDIVQSVGDRGSTPYFIVLSKAEESEVITNG